MTGISLHNVTKLFDNGVVAINDVTLEINEGEFMVLVGPSGCGKSTILRVIAGLEDATSGSISIGGRDVTDLAPKDRDIAMVFQDYALYPHMTVDENLRFPLKLRKTPKPEAKMQVDGAVRVLGLETLLTRKPGELSGGQRQRVAMGRAMVREPRAFLMDEPLSNLDAKLRVRMRAELARLRDQLKTTTAYVTHDQTEAMTLGDRVAVLSSGVLQQVDTPHNLYRNPANLFVAAFIGSPSMNLVEARIERGRAFFGGFDLAIQRRYAEMLDGKDVILGIRPTDFEDASLERSDGLDQIEVTVEVVEDLGSEVVIIFRIDASPVESDEVVAAVEADDDAVLVYGGDSVQRSAFTAQVGANTRARPGQKLQLTVNHDGFHFFDPESGLRLS